MRQHLLILTCILTLIGNLSAQVDRMVIVEEFTNASCGPCEAQNPDFNDLLLSNLDRVIPIKYQTAFPGYDPYNEQNPTEVDQRRRNVYGEITGVPTAAIDGVVPNNDYGGGGLSTWIQGDNGYAGGPYGYNQNVLNYAKSIPTFLEVNVDVAVDSLVGPATVTVNINNHDSLASGANNVLHLLLVEKENLWPTPPGSTSESEFFYIMRKMYPDQNGTVLPAIDGDSTHTKEYNINFPDYLYNLNSLAVVAFVQNTATREIINAGIDDEITFQAPYPNLEISGITTVENDELCNKLITPGMVVANNGETEITSFDAQVTVDGELTTVLITDTLKPGEDLEVTFDEIQISGSTGSTSFSLANINEGELRPSNTLNLFTGSNTYPGVEQLEENETSYDFESSPVGLNIGGVIVQYPDAFDIALVVNQAAIGANSSMGGYGQSEKSIWVNFWQWDTRSLNPRGDIILGRELSMEDQGRLVISFDRAHAQYVEGNFMSNDRLEGYISFDCGDNWQQVYDKAGSALATSNPSSNFFAPSPNQWATDSIVIDDLDADQVLFKFEPVSNWGNNLYLDNIMINGEEALSAGSPILESSLEIAPNPAIDQAFLSFTSKQTDRVDIGLYNSMGQRVATIAEREFYAGYHKLPIRLSHLPSGIYQVVMMTAEGQETLPLIKH